MSTSRKIPVDVLVAEPKEIDALAFFQNLGNCSFLDRRDDCPVRVIATYGCIPQHTNAHLLNAHCLYLENMFLYNLSYDNNKISKQTASKISEDIKHKIFTETIWNN